VLLAVCTQRPTLRWLLASAVMTVSPVVGEVGQDLVVLRQDGQHAVGLLERGDRPADGLVEVLPVAGDTGAELVDDDA